MKVSSVCKTTAGGLFILGFLSAISTAKDLGEFFDGEFSWGIFFFIALSTFVFCLLIYAIGEIVEKLHTANNNTYAIYNLLQKTADNGTANAASQKSVYTPTASSAQKPVNSSWVCKHCSARNDATALFCKNCGTYK